jgi:uncharacterized membrane protein
VLSFFLQGDGQKRLSLGRMVNQSTMLLMISIGSLILILALLILFHENATKGYDLRKLEADRSAYYLEQEVLNMQIAEAQALQYLSEDAQIMSMIPVKNPQYVKAATTAPSKK